LSYMNKEQQVIQDSVRLNNGLFSFTGFIDAPAEAVFKGTTSYHVDDPNFTEVFLEPAEMNAVVKVNDFKHIHITGSKTQAEYEEVNEEKEPIRQEMLPLDSAYTNNRTAMLKDKSNPVFLAKFDSLRALYKPFNEQLNKIDYQFIATHSTSYLSAYFMFYDLESWSLDSAEMLYTSLSPAIQNSYLGKKVGSRLRAKEVNTAGKTIQDINGKDINGKDISLSSFKGKGIVLIDFWASWCGPCRQANPHLIELYKKYHDKGFDIISISVDKDTAAWKGAVAKDKIGIWHQLLDNSLAESFGINGIPTQLLIDKTGAIAGRYVGFNPNEKEGELDKKLALLTAQP